MFKLKHSVVAVALALPLALPQLAQAQSSREGGSGDVYFGLKSGIGWTDEDRFPIIEGQAYDYEGGADTFELGLELGYRFLPNWELRGFYSDVKADVDNLSRSASGDMYGIDMLYSFSPKFYGGLGVVREDLAGFETSFYRGTLGYRTFMSENVAFRWETNLHQSRENLTEVFTNIGVQWFFGGESAQQQPTPAPRRVETPVQRPTPTPAPAPVAAPVDSDNDGVNDELDKCPGTPATYSVDADGCIEYDNETVTETLLVEFEINSSIIRENAKGDIKDMADFMKEHPQLDIVIEGHTDDTGAADYNQWLSERRARAVGDSLINDFGIAANRVSTVGFGESQPKVEGTSASARQANRRIEAKLSVTNRVPVERD